MNDKDDITASFAPLPAPSPVRLPMPYLKWIHYSPAVLILSDSGYDEIVFKQRHQSEIERHEQNISVIVVGRCSGGEFAVVEMRTGVDFIAADEGELLRWETGLKPRDITYAVNQWHEQRNLELPHLPVDRWLRQYG